MYMHFISQVYQRQTFHSVLHTNTSREREHTNGQERGMYALLKMMCVQLSVPLSNTQYTSYRHTQIEREWDITDHRGKPEIWPNSHQWECSMQERQQLYSTLLQLALNPVVKLANTEIGGPLPNKSQLARADRSLKVYHMNLYCYHAHYCT